MIRVDEVRLVGPDGDQLGIVPIDNALQKAEDLDFDLVEVAPSASPPVCRIMDYGKFKYQQSKKAHISKKKQTVVHIKEVKMSPKTEEHDIKYKVKNIRRFLEGGDKAKVTMVFKGREITHANIGKEILERVAEQIEDIGTIEQKPRLEGKHMVMIIAPQK